MAYQHGLKYGLKAVHFALRHRALVGGAVVAVGAFATHGVATVLRSLSR